MKISTLFRFILSNFGPLIAFYVAHHYWGVRVAIVVSLVWALAEWGVLKWRGQTVGRFFRFSVLMSLVFGVCDFYLAKATFFKFEAALSNLVVGLYFAWSLRGDKPIIQEFAEAQGRVKNPSDPSTRRLFVYLTVIWAVYQFVKAGFYVWVGFHYTLEEGLVVRSVVGNTSFYALLALSIFGAPYLKRFLHS